MDTTLNKMKPERLPKQLLNYRLRGRRHWQTKDEMEMVFGTG
jgi:hypothetical protein